MNKTVRDAVQTAQALRKRIGGVEGVEVVVFPPFTVLGPVEKVLNGTSIGLGAQNMYFEEKGAYTGEISPLMLADLCEFVIIGHS